MSGTIGIPVLRDGETPDDLWARALECRDVKAGCYRLTGKVEDWFVPDNEDTAPEYRGKWRSRWFEYEKVCPCPKH